MVSRQPEPGPTRSAPPRPAPSLAPPPALPGRPGSRGSLPITRGPDPSCARVGARSCLWRHRQAQASTLERAQGLRREEPSQREPPAQPAAPARPGGRPKLESPAGPEATAASTPTGPGPRPRLGLPLLPPTAPLQDLSPSLGGPRFPPPAVFRHRRHLNRPPSPPRRQPRPSFRPRRPPAARPRYREYGGGRGESRLGPKRANRSPPQVPPPPPAASDAPLLPPYAGTRLPA